MSNTMARAGDDSGDESAGGDRGAPVEDCSSSLRIGVKALDGLPLFALRVLLLGGASCERQQGEAWVAGRMLAEGTKLRDWQRLSVELEDRGISLSSAGGLESHGLAIDCLAEDWRWALDCAAEIVYDSSFSEDRCEWVKSQGAAELESLFDQPDAVAGWAFLDQLYRPHAAGRPLLGAPGQLASVTSSGAFEFHRLSLDKGLVVTAAGAVDGEQVAARIRELFSGAAAQGPQMASNADTKIEGRAIRRLEVEVPADGQCHLYAGHLTTNRHHPDVPALELLAVTLGAGAGLSGRLPTRLREAEGLSYTTEVATLAGAGSGPGRLAVYCACAPRRVHDAETAIRDELERVLAGGIHQDEVSAARNYLVGRLALQRETARQWCDLLAESLFYGLPCWDSRWQRSRLEEIDAAQVTAVARRHLDPSRLAITVGTART